MEPIRLSTIGCTELNGPDGRSILSVLSQPKRFALLVYLAVAAPGRFVRRDRLVALFWPEHDADRARANLSKALSFLRKSLGPNVVLTRGDEEVGVDQRVLRCDVVELAEAGQAEASAWPNAVDGRFLDGFHFDGAPREWDEWVEQVAAKCSTAGAGAASRTDVERSTDWAQRAVPPSPSGNSGVVAENRRHGRFWRGALPWALVAVVGTVLLVSSRSPEVGRATYDWGFPPEAPMSFTGGSYDGVGYPAFSLSSRGDFFVYVAEHGDATELWYRSLEDVSEVHSIEGTEGAYFPMVSPDGEWVAFLRDAQLQKVPIGGGAAVPLLEVEPHAESGHWVSMNQILVVDDDATRIRIVDPTTGQITSERRRSGMCQLPFMLSNGHVLCNHFGPYRAKVLHRDSSVTRDLQQGGQRAFGSSLRFVGEGYVTFVTAEGALQIAPFDPETLQLGRPATMVPSVRREGLTGAAHYAVTPSGVLVYAPGDNAEEGQLVRRARGEAVSRALDVDPASFITFDLSPDGERLAAVTAAIDGLELWVYELRGGRSYRWLTSELDDLREPRWSPSGEKLVVRAFSEALGKRVIMVGDPSPGLLPSDTIDFNAIPDEFLSDDRLLVSSGGILDLYRSPPAIVDTVTGFMGAVSPDGRWRAYGDRGSGRHEVMLERFPAGGPRITIPTDGGQEPVWLSSTELAYRRGRTWYTVSIAGGQPSEPQEWFSDDRFVDTAGRSQAPSRDGGVIYLQGTAQSTAPFLRVIPNWLEGAKRDADEANRVPN